MRPFSLFIILAFTFNFASGQISSINSKLDELKKTDKSNLEAAGIITLYGDILKEIDPVSSTVYHGFDGYEGRWSDVSLEARARNKAWYQDILDLSLKINRITLKKEDILNLSLIEKSASQYISTINYNLDLMPVDQMNGSHLMYPMLIGSINIYSKTDADNVLRLLETLDKAIDQTMVLMQEGAKLGITPAKIAMAPVPQQIRNVANASVENSPFYSAFKKLEFFSNSEEKLKYQQSAKDIITSKINPAYQKLLTYIENEYYSKCREIVSLSSVADGKEKYRFLVKMYTSTDLAPEQIHQTGLDEVKRIKNKMAALRQEAGFKGTESEFNEFLRNDAQFYYTSAEDLLEGYRVICKEIDPELIRLFGVLPRLPYGVKAMPDFMAASSPTAYYYFGSYKLGNPGYFYANTYDLKSRPTWEMEALALHEAVPGHHFQFAIEEEIERADFRKFGYFTSFVEGWGLYSESLGEQLGLYKDVYHKYGQLTFELWRAIRLVVDTGIHYYGWERDKAIQYFTDNSPRAVKDIQVEVDRYIAFPGQAVSYKVGQLKIMELKNMAQKELGDKFDIRSFHDMVLGSGGIPLSVLENNVREWIALQK